MIKTRYVPSFLLLFAIALSGKTASAQTTSNNNNNNSLQKSIKDIGQLFKKKKDSSAIPKNQQLPAVKNAVSNGANPGDILPGAKSLQADLLQPFKNGVAVIMKGNAYAMIDANADVVIPFNTYGVINDNIDVQRYAIFMNGLFRYRTINEQEWGFLNASGKVIARGVMNDLDENKKVIKQNNSGRIIYTTPEGKTFTHHEQLYEIGEGFGISRITTDNGNKAVWAYKKLSGEAITGPIFDEAYHFSEGMAVVGKKNEFGEMKYGFINQQGKLIIPFSFSIKPADFTGGYSKVQPKDKSEFEYAFIDKTGAVVFRQTSGDVVKYGPFDHFTIYGLAFSGKYILDAQFKLQTKADFFKSFGIPADSWFIQEGTYIEGETNPKLVFSTRTAVSPITRMPVVGFINLATKKVIMPVFDLHDLTTIYFDPAAHLAYAKVCLGKNTQGGLIYREGYINEDGLFAMVKAAGEKW